MGDATAAKEEEKKDENKKAEVKDVSTPNDKNNGTKAAKKDTNGCCCNTCGHHCGHHCGCHMGCHTCHHPCSPKLEKWVHGNVLGGCCCNNGSKDCKEPCKECKAEDCK